MIHVKNICLLTAAALWLGGAGWSPQAQAQNLPQDDTSHIQQQLEKLMVRQPPLTEDDVRLYLANVESIFRLRFEPQLLEETVKSIGGWPEDRFAYVTTKMAVGMSMLMRPDDPRHNAVDEFARPTPAELALIKRYQDELTRAMERVQARYAANNDN